LVPAPKNSSYVFADTPEGLDFTIGQYHKDAFILDYEDENCKGGYFYKHSSNVDNLIDPQMIQNTEDSLFPSWDVPVLTKFG